MLEQDLTMPKPLSFKGDAPLKNRKRKHAAQDASVAGEAQPASLPIEDDDSWVVADAASDLAGPVLLILPPPHPTPHLSKEERSAFVTCVACDANGDVFASTLENVPDDADPGAVAEPHDVRQVWVASRVAGTGEGVVSLKGHHGK